MAANLWVRGANSYSADRKQSFLTPVMFTAGYRYGSRLSTPGTTWRPPLQEIKIQIKPRAAQGNAPRIPVWKQYFRLEIWSARSRLKLADEGFMVRHQNISFRSNNEFCSTPTSVVRCCYKIVTLFSNWHPHPSEIATRYLSNRSDRHPRQRKHSKPLIFLIGTFDKLKVVVNEGSL